MAGWLEAARQRRLTPGAGKAFASDPANPNFALDTDNVLDGFGSRAFDAVALGRENRKKIRKATRFKTSSERLRIESELAFEDAQLHLAQRHALRDSDGNMILDSAGRPVFAWRRNLETPMLEGGVPLAYDAATLRVSRGGPGVPVYELLGRGEDGELQQLTFQEYLTRLNTDPASVDVRTRVNSELLDQNHANALPALERAQLLPVTSFQARYRPEEQFVYNTRYLEELSLRDGQAVLSMIGYEGIVAPLLADDHGRGRLVTTKTPDGDAKVAMYGVNYLDNSVKQRPKGMTDDEYCIYLHTINRYVGGEDDAGNIIDMPARFGIDVYSPAGQAEIEAEHAGMPSAFDRIRLAVPIEIQRAAIADAKAQMRGENGRTLRQSIEVLWGEASEQYTASAAAVANALANNNAELEAYRLEIRGAAMELGIVRNKLNAAKEALVQLPEITTNAQDLAARIAPTRAHNELLAQLSSLSAAAQAHPLTARLEQVRSQVQATASSVLPVQEYEQLVAQLEHYNEQMRVAKNDAASLAELEEREKVAATKAKQLANDILTASEKSVAYNDEATELAETMEYMFEMRQAAAGRKGRKGTSDLSTLIDMKDKDAKIREGTITALQSQADTVAASVIRLLKTADFDTTQLETMLTDAVRQGTEGSRSSRKKLQEATGLQNSIVAKMEKVLTTQGHTPRRPDWRE
jgi:hypothetical protein